MGSLNGIFLNFKVVYYFDIGSRNWGDLKEFVIGDVIIVGIVF